MNVTLKATALWLILVITLYPYSASGQPKSMTAQIWPQSEIHQLSNKDVRGLTLFNNLVIEGMSPHLAAGIVGNASQESDFLPHLSGKSGIGICQWCGYRKRGLIKFAASNKLQWTNSTLQAKWIVHEVKNGTEKEIFAKLLTAKTPTETAKLICHLYEKPNKKKANLNYRISEAKRFYKLWLQLTYN